MNTTRLKAVLLAATVLLAAVAAPVSAQLGIGDDEPETLSIVQHNDQPSFVVDYSDGEYQSLQTWANSSEDRSIVSRNNGLAVVAVPKYEAVDVSTWRIAYQDPGAIYDALTTDPLTTKAFVDSVSPNYEHAVDPVTALKSESTVSTPDLGLTTKVLNPSTALFGEDLNYSKSGVAYSEDANRTTMRESRQILGVDNVTQTGANQTIAVIDTGVNTANGSVFGNGTEGSDMRIHEDSKNYITNETVYADGIDAVQDGNGHGTWVASSIAANTSNDVHDGIAPDSTLLVLKALADDGSGSTGDIAAAVRYAADHDADVISMSLGSPVYDPALADAVSYALDKGSVVVIAAGNSRQTVRYVASPADTDGAITVAATNDSNSTQAASAYFSQVAPDPGTADGSEGVTADEGIDVAAPGMSTVARVPDEEGDVSNNTLSGTSMATPMVAGGIALALEKHPSWSPEDARKWVRDSARPMPNAGVTEVGHGMFAADNMVTKSVPDTSQREARTNDARGRDATNRALSNSSGGLLFAAVPVRSGVI